MFNLIRIRIDSDDGFMGKTHALSGLALILVIIAFFPKLTEYFGIAGSISLIIAAIILTVGASLLPDFDNVKSTAISTLGVVGVMISTVMRSVARAVYAITRSKYDKPNADPHRGFWHTIIAGLLVGFLAYLSVLGGSKISLPFPAPYDNLGHIVLFLYILIGTQLCIAIFFKKSVSKLTRGTGGRIVNWIIGITATALLMSTFPTVDGYLWVWGCISGGWIIHILGDTFTTSGTPLFAPIIPRKGHRWWTHRFPPHMKAGGATENYVVIPLFTIIIAISIGFIFLS